MNPVCVLWSIFSQIFVTQIQLTSVSTSQNPREHVYQSPNLIEDQASVVEPRQVLQAIYLGHALISKWVRSRESPSM